MSDHDALRKFAADTMRDVLDRAARSTVATNSRLDAVAFDASYTRAAASELALRLERARVAGLEVA